MTHSLDTIVCGVDDSAPAFIAARPGGVSMSPSTLVRETLATGRQVQEHATRWLYDLAFQLDAADAEQLVTPFGDPARRLAELAEERAAGLLVVGSRGRTAVRDALLGSVSGPIGRQRARSRAHRAAIRPGIARSDRLDPTAAFVLKDGEHMWAWIGELFGPERRVDVQSIGERAWTTLGGYLRGVTLVALFDAAFIGLALVVVGVPLVLVLVVLTFVGAYVPIVGAWVAGLAAVLVALVAEGPVAAAVIAGAVMVVQQVESNVLQPVVVGRSVHLHPVVILLAVTAGGVLGGIIGAVVAAPMIAVLVAVLRYMRFERDRDCAGPQNAA